jgi:ISXO2 transposase-like protein
LDEVSSAVDASISQAMVSSHLSPHAVQARDLQRRIGSSPRSDADHTWKLKHKLKQVMLERDATKPLTGRVEIDDTYIGGERSGGKRGRGAPGKTPVVVAVETTSDGKPVRLKLRRVTFCAVVIAAASSMHPTVASSAATAAMAPA